MNTNLIKHPECFGTYGCTVSELMECENYDLCLIYRSHLNIWVRNHEDYLDWITNQREETP